MSTSDAPELYYVPYDVFLADVRTVAHHVESSKWSPDFVVGVGRGGLVPAVYISHQLGLPMLSVDHSSKEVDFADELLRKVAEKSAAGTRLLFVDDINDSGGTIAYIRRILTENGCDISNLRFAVVITNTSSKVTVDYWAAKIDRAQDKRWFVFPWEAVETSEALVEAARAVPERLA
jgi:xanthine phosphoribosyltransferase